MQITPSAPNINRCGFEYRIKKYWFVWIYGPWTGDNYSLLMTTILPFGSQKSARLSTPYCLTRGQVTACSARSSHKNHISRGINTVLRREKCKSEVLPCLMSCGSGCRWLWQSAGRYRDRIIPAVRPHLGVIFLTSKLHPFLVWWWWYTSCSHFSECSAKNRKKNQKKRNKLLLLVFMLLPVMFMIKNTDGAVE